MRIKFAGLAYVGIRIVHVSIFYPLNFVDHNSETTGTSSG